MSCGPLAAVILDFDGVLVESVDVKTRAFASLYGSYGADIVRKVVEYHLQHGGVSRYAKFRHFHNVLLRKPLGAAEEAELGQRFSELVEDAVVEAAWVGGARQFLEKWHAHRPLFVASGTPDEELRRIIARRQMSHYFAGVRGASATKAEIISAFLAEYHFAPTHVVMVGDARTDFEAAVETGVGFIGVSGSGVHPFPETVPVLRDLSTLDERLSAPALR